jgi:apolipoprotein N-acyltransferase
VETRERWLRALTPAGVVLMLVGALDPLEGSVAVLVGSGLVTLGVFLGAREPRRLAFWTWVFGLIAFGVGALWVLSALGGFGGESARSNRWALLILPYPVGWIMGIVALLVRAVQRIRHRPTAA